MPEGKKHMFASYVQRDSKTVLPFIKMLQGEYEARALNVDVWTASDALTPGEQWMSQIENALRDSIGLLAFLSPSALQGSFAIQEMGYFLAADSDRLIIPIILQPLPSLPILLAKYQAIDLSGGYDHEKLVRAIRDIANATEQYLKSYDVRSPVSPEALPIVAASIAESVRRVRPEALPPTESPDTVFLVHGHDSKRLEELQTYLAELGVKAVVLSKIAGSSQSLFQKFLQFSKDVRFAVVLLTADDVGASTIQYEADGVGEKALQFRARQNVILELGFFYGYLGWENVFVISGPPHKIYPNFEPPSDLAGVVFDAIDDPSWKASLTRKLTEAKFKLTPSS